MSGYPTGLGDYEVRGVLGSGASGTVYLARQELLDRDVALKELSAELTASPTFRERFRQEAEIMATLDDDNCVRVYDFIQREEHDYLASELVDGASLRAVLQHSGQLTPEQAFGVTKGALSGLVRAHMLGLLHRDIKPENILVDKEGVSKLADFGQAGAIASNGPGGASASYLGSPAYMSPEVIAGGVATVQSDIYSVGAMLYELLTGRPPFVADSPLAVMRMHQHDPVPDPRQFNPNLSAGVAQFLLGCLAKDAGARPTSTRSTLSTMRAVAAEAYGADWEKRSSVKKKVAAAMGAGLGLLAGIGGAGALAATGAVGQAVTAEGVYAAATAAGTAGTATVGTAATGGVLGVSTWLAVAIGVGVLAAVGGGALLLSGAFSPHNNGPLAVVSSPSPSPSPSPSDVPSPTPEPSPSPSPSASPSPSPSPSPSASPTPTASVRVTARPTAVPTQQPTPPGPPPPPPPGPIMLTNPLGIWYSICDAAGNNCSAPKDGNGAVPMFACNSSVLDLYEQYTWSFPGNPGTTTPINISWSGTLNSAGTKTPYSSSRISVRAQSGRTNVFQPAGSTPPTQIPPDSTYNNANITYTMSWVNPDGSPDSGPQSSSYTFTWGCG